MNILFACHRFPYPPNRGGKIRPFNFISHLAKSHRVTVATVAHTREEAETGAPLRNHCSDLIYDVVPSPIRWMQAGLSLPTSDASSMKYFYSGKVIRKVREASARQPFDCVIVHCAFAAQFVENIPAKFKVMDFGDLDSGKWLEYSEVRSFPSSLAYGLEARKLRRYELRLTREFNLCTFTAPGELDQFRAIAPEAKSELISNGVDSVYFRLRPPRKDRPPIIGFLGRMDYFPNVQGAVWFAKNAFPLIQKEVPDARFRIIGSNPIASIRELTANPGVEVTGSVADVREFLNDVAVSVVPLTLARGTQNKILECMSMGVPVLCTPEAAKGVNANLNRDYLMASTAEQFTAESIRVLRDQQIEQELAVNARTQVEMAHNWALSMVKLDSLLATSPSLQDSETLSRSAR